MNGNLEHIAALATIIGVVGGLISLYFLIHEVRRSAQAIEGATVQSLMNFEKDVFALIAGNASLYLRGCENIAQLSAEDRLRFNRIVAAQMSLFYSAFVQFEQALIDDEVWEAYLVALRRHLKAPGFLESWKATEASYPASFRRMIDKG